MIHRQSMGARVWRIAGLLWLISVLVGCPSTDDAPGSPTEDDDDSAEEGDDDAQADNDDAQDGDDWPECPDGVLPSTASAADLAFFCAAGCTEVGGAVSIDAGGDDDDAPMGHLLDGLDCLIAVHGALTIHDLPVGATEVHLEALERVGEGLSVHILNGQALSVSFAALHSVGAAVEIAGPHLQTVSMPSLVSADGLALYTEGLSELSLPSLVELPATHLGGGLHLHAEELVCEFSSLASVGGNLVVEAMPTARAAFPVLETVGGALVLGTSPGVVDLPVLTSIGVNPHSLGNESIYVLARVEPPGDLSLPALESVGGDVAVQSFPGLGPWSLAAPSLVTIGGDLLVGASSSLDRVALDEAQAVGGSLVVDSNEQLQALELAGLASVGGDFFILDNLLLPTSQVEALAAQVGEENIGGSVLIEGNGPD